MWPMTSHRDNALEHLNHHAGATEQLEMLHRIPAEQRPEHHVAAAYTAKRDAIALAKVEALLEIGEQLAILNGSLALSKRLRSRSGCPWCPSKPLGSARLTAPIPQDWEDAEVLKP